MANELQHNTCDEPRKMSYELIKHITNDLDTERIVGSGGFGTVYRGVYENGEEIAVKILRNMSGFDGKEFLKEFRNLRSLKHQNIVELVGFCNETKEVVAEYEGKQVVAIQIHTALCFEYVQNGSLRKHISDEYTGLNWLTRYKIIKGICRGLKYLREGLKSPVMHLDLKPDNILLDQAMVPKIADFGSSRLFGEENTKKTISSVGTLGYLPPEYIELQVISENFDIFSLGVIITKIITGHEGYNSIADMAPTKFVKQVHDKWRTRLLQILEPRPLEVYCHQIKRCIEIALECIKRNRQERPSIQRIVSILLETETIIGDLGLQAEQFPDGESIDTGNHLPKRHLAANAKENALLRERNIPERPPGIPTNSPTGKTKSKQGILSTLPMDLPLDFLKKITNDFSDERKVSVDAFGTVYKGILPDGEVIAVKRLSEASPVPCLRAFTNEIQNLMALNHQNIVKLVGSCHERTKKVVPKNGRYMLADIVEIILCHEYLPQGSLQKNLFEVPSIMDWDTRFNIIKGICHGLHFLHSNSIIHMDLKPETIFLDDEMEPKIASFGLSRLFGQEQTRANTLNVVGSNGYMPPEYMYRGEISAQSDIYSLGLVIIETTTGEKNIPKKNEPSAREFIEKVYQKWTEEYMESVYKQLNSDQLREVKFCIQTGLSCVNIDRKNRLSMETIIEVLSGLSPTPSASDSYFVLSQRKTLDVEPLQLRFLSERKRSTTRFLYLTNSTNNHIAFRLLTETPKMYLTKLPLCGIVPPNCTYTLCVTMREHVKAPPSNSNQFLSLQTREVLGRYGEYVDKPDSVPEFLERASEVEEVKVTVSYELPARRSIFRRKQKNQSVQREIEIIDGQNYRQVLSVDMHSTEPWILTTNQRGYAFIWNYQTQAEVHCFEVSREEAVYSAKFIEREEWLVVGGGDGYIYVYRYDTMEEVTSVGAHGGRRPVTCLAVHPTHSLMLSASDDDLIKLWDWKNNWQCTRTFEWHNNRVTQVMFDPNDSNSFASTSLEGTVKIWKMSSGMCIIALDEHSYGLHCLHYVTCDNRQLLVSGSSDGAAKIWDLQTDCCVDTLKGHTNHLNALWWHRELPVLITGSADGTVQIWKFTDNTYRLESIIGFNLGSVNALGYMKTLKRIVVGCEQGIAMMEVNLP